MLKRERFKNSTIIALMVFLCFVPVAKVLADSPPVTVIVPQVRPPFDKIFSQIYEGIEQQTDGNARQVTIEEDASRDRIKSLLEGSDTATIIGLGNRVKQLLEPFGDEYNIVYGAVFLNPDNEPNGAAGISLTPSPDATFKWLKILTPEIEIVHAVYQPDYSGWLIDLAKRAAPDHNLRVIGHPVNNAREAATEFRDILETSNPDSHAIWLMQRDPTLDEKAVVPDILAQAWGKDFVVFSSNPAHVPRGALFALYPDNEKMGRSLAEMALSADPDGVVPLTDLLIAINIRTASHVGKSFTRREQKQFDLIFPNR